MIAGRTSTVANLALLRRHRREPGSGTFRRLAGQVIVAWPWQPATNGNQQAKNILGTPSSVVRRQRFAISSGQKALLRRALAGAGPGWRSGRHNIRRVCGWRRMRVACDLPGRSATRGPGGAGPGHVGDRSHLGARPVSNPPHPPPRPAGGLPCRIFHCTKRLYMRLFSYRRFFRGNVLGNGGLSYGVLSVPCRQRRGRRGSVMASFSLARGDIARMVLAGGVVHHLAESSSPSRRLRVDRLLFCQSPLGFDTSPLRSRVFAVPPPPPGVPVWRARRGPAASFAPAERAASVSLGGYPVLLYGCGSKASRRSDGYHANAESAGAARHIADRGAVTPVGASRPTQLGRPPQGQMTCIIPSRVKKPVRRRGAAAPGDKPGHVSLRAGRSAWKASAAVEAGQSGRDLRDCPCSPGTTGPARAVRRRQVGPHATTASPSPQVGLASPPWSLGGIDSPLCAEG